MFSLWDNILLDTARRPGVKKLWKAAVERQGSVIPAVRDELLDISPRKVLLTLGFPVFGGKPETDGPPGVACLLNAFASAELTILVDTNFYKLFKELFHEMAKEGFTPYAEVVTLSEAEGGYQVAISVEKPGMNRVGIYHNMSGYSISRLVDPVDRFFLSLKEKGTYTVGIGDGGNEAGMGLVEDVVRKHVPYGDVCRCPCRHGIASCVTFNRLIVAEVSNWGGLVLSMALGAKPMNLWRAYKACFSLMVKKGFVDGITGEKGHTEDSNPITRAKAIFSKLTCKGL